MTQVPGARPIAQPIVQIESPRLAQRRPGLGRWFGFGAVVSVLVPIALLTVSLAMEHLAGGWLPGGVIDGAVAVAGVLVALGIMMAPFSVVLSVLATSVGFPFPQRGKISAEPGGALVERYGRRSWIPRERIADGILLPGHSRPRVELRLADGQVVSAEVEDEDQGQRLLAALGIGPERRRAEVALGSPNRQLAAGCLGMPFAMIGWLMLLVAVLPREVFEHAFTGLGWAVAFLLTTLGLWRVARPGRVVVGSDGVRIHRLFSEIWMPYAELDQVKVKERTLTLFGRGRAQTVEVRTPMPDVALGLADRIEQAMALRGGAQEAGVGAAALERRGRPLAAWREAVRALLAHDAGYRAAALTPEDVMSVLGDPEAPREQRIGAALALRAAGHPEAPQRIRIAADASADEPLRHALEQAADEALEEAALEEALSASASK